MVSVLDHCSAIGQKNSGASPPTPINDNLIKNRNNKQNKFLYYKLFDFHFRKIGSIDIFME